MCFYSKYDLLQRNKGEEIPPLCDQVRNKCSSNSLPLCVCVYSSAGGHWSGRCFHGRRKTEWHLARCSWHRDRLQWQKKNSKLPNINEHTPRYFLIPHLLQSKKANKKWNCLPHSCVLSHTINPWVSFFSQWKAALTLAPVYLFVRFHLHAELSNGSGSLGWHTH